MVLGGCALYYLNAICKEIEYQGKMARFDSAKLYEVLRRIEMKLDR
jgi:hypothetical protein